MHKQILLYTAAIISLSSFQLAAAETQLDADKPGIRDACFEETTRINHPTKKPSAVPCKKALLDREYESREDRSIKYFNLALIQEATGEIAEAFENLKRSVSLTKQIDKRQIALAQLAHKLGDLATAEENYRVVQSNPGPAISKETLAVVKRNYQKLSAGQLAFKKRNNGLTDNAGR